MGETTSTWSLPLHSSDTEHPRMKRRDSRGSGGPLRINRGEHNFISAPGDPTAGIEHPGVNASSVLTNPFDKHSR
jgi:hypothetical protein